MSRLLTPDHKVALYYALQKTLLRDGLVAACAGTCAASAAAAAT